MPRAEYGTRKQSLKHFTKPAGEAGRQQLRPSAAHLPPRVDRARAAGHNPIACVMGWGWQWVRPKERSRILRQADLVVSPLVNITKEIPAFWSSKSDNHPCPSFHHLITRLTRLFLRQNIPSVSSLGQHLRTLLVCYQEQLCVHMGKNLA